MYDKKQPLVALLIIPVVQPFRLTISLIQIGAKGDVQPLETG